MQHDDNRAMAEARSPYRPPRRLPRRAGGYWPVAVAEVVAAILIALILPGIETDHHWHDGLSYDASTAQATLAAIAGGMITLTGFVLTAVTLMIQTVQGQSSRLLQSLKRLDRSPLLFGTFTATFTYSLLVLGGIDGSQVPEFSVTLALIMVLVCAAQFLRLLVTFRKLLSVGGLATAIGNDVRVLIDVLYPGPFVPRPGGAVPAPAPVPGSGSGSGSGSGESRNAGWTVCHAGEPGVFQSFRELAAVRLATRAGAQIAFIPAVGDFVATGATLAEGTGASPGPAALRKLVRIGSARTLEQDPAYGIRVLVDIAIRALSPAVNDPTSAVQVLDQIDDILHRLAGRSLGDGLLHDAAGRVVVRYPAPTWESFLALAIDEILLYGATSLQVTRRLRALLDDLLTGTPRARWPAVHVKLGALHRATRRSVPDETDAAEAAKPDRQGIGSSR